MLGSVGLGTTITCAFSLFLHLSLRTVILCHQSLAPPREYYLCFLFPLQI